MAKNLKGLDKIGNNGRARDLMKFERPVKTSTDGYIHADGRGPTLNDYVRPVGPRKILY